MSDSVPTSDLPHSSSSRPVLWVGVGLVFGLAISYLWPSESLRADTDRDSGGKFAVVTCEAQTLGGQPDVIFVLDFSTGRLSGGAINLQTGRFSQFYMRNIAGDFKLTPEMQPKFVITSCQLNISGQGPVLPAKDGIVVAELNSGLVNVYSFPYSVNGRGGGVQPLAPLDQFSFRQAGN